MSSETKKKILFAGDLALLAFAVHLAVNLRLTHVNVFSRYTGATFFVVLIYLLSFFVFDLYSLRLKFTSASYLSRFLFAILAGSALMTTVFYFLPKWRFGRGILVLTIVVATFLLYGWRLLFQMLFHVAAGRRTIAIVGAGNAGRTIYDILSTKDFDIKGFLDDDPGKTNERVGFHAVLGPTSLLAGMAQRKDIDTAVVAITHERSPELLRSLAQARMNGAEIFDMAQLFEMQTGRIPVLHLRQGWIVFTRLQGIQQTLYTGHIKRLLDLVLAFVGIVFLLPFGIAVAAAIKLDSAGPVFFRQKRVGLEGRTYDIVKFRSMVDDAEKNGAQWAEVNDPRVTRVGKIMRKTRIDELPQFWNVLRGQMSFVGPRPERPEFVETLKEEIPFYYFRHVIKPGITGWAQINYRYGASKNDALEKLQYDFYYIKNLSPFLDLHILLKTIRVVLFGQGAR